MGEELQSKGAVIIGSGKVSEFRLSCFLEGNESPHNPIAKEEGYSSVTGAGLAVYSGMARAGFVTDLLGSKATASFLGLPIFTPSESLFHPKSYYSELRRKFAMRPSIIAKNVDDIDYLFEVFHSCNRKHQLPPPPYKLGWSRDLDSICSLQTNIDILEESIFSLKNHNCQIQEISLDLDTSLLVHAANLLACSKYIPILNIIEKQRICSIDDLSDSTKSWLNYAKEVPGVVLAYSINYLSVIENTLDRLLQDIDFIVAPAMPFLQKDLDKFTGYQYLPEGVSKALTFWSYLLPFAYTGHPSAVLGISQTKDQEPLAIQIIGKKEEDHKLLDMLKHLDNCFHYRPPKHQI